VEKEKTITTAIRIKPSEKKYFEERAEKLGINFSDFLKRGAHFYAGFDLEFMKRLENFSKAVEETESQVLESLTISWMARKDAASESEFPVDESILIEFSKTKEGPLRGDALYKMMKEFFMNKFAKEKSKVSNQ
jgi:hypothetical protein